MKYILRGPDLPRKYGLHCARLPNCTKKCQPLEIKKNQLRDHTGVDSKV